jgi:hypothetical protein
VKCLRFSRQTIHLLAYKTFFTPFEMIVAKGFAGGLKTKRLNQN